MIRNKKKESIAIHVIAWNLLIFFNFLFLKGNEIPFSFLRELSILLIYIFVFYAGYFFTSRFFLKKKIFLFVLLSLLLLGGTSFVKISIKHPERERIERMLNKLRPSGDDAPSNPSRRFRNSIFNPMMLFSFYSLLLIYFVSIFLKVYQNWVQNEKQKVILQKEKNDAELQFLKQQINPHFLFNSLNSIYSLAHKNSNKTAETILKLSTILRYILYHSKKQYVLLDDEISALKDYIELQQLRITEKTSLEFKVLGNTHSFKIEPLLLMPLLENAFKHGIDSINESFIKISINIIENNLELYIANTIVPAKNVSQDESGIGLANIKRRLEILYPENYKFNIKNDEKVFQVNLELTLKK